MAKIKVGINGFGTIGKRVAHAVSLQNDMMLVGVANRSANINIKHMLGPRGPLSRTPLYYSGKKIDNWKTAGNLEDLLKKVDVIIDCTPGGIEKTFKPLYEKHNVKQIYQGGADAGIAETSFNALANYNKSLRKKSTRVVSCNTTSLSRTLFAISKAIKIKCATAVLVRRATDPPDDAEKGPINSVVPVTTVPSHHGPDVQTILPIKITTMACKVPTTLNHAHFVIVDLAEKCTRQKALNTLKKADRVLLFKASDGYNSTSQIFEMFRDINRPRDDMYEVSVWEETVSVFGNKLYWSHVVHSEAIIVPENIDAIRALMGVPQKKSMAKTNKSLGIL